MELVALLAMLVQVGPVDPAGPVAVVAVKRRLIQPSVLAVLGGLLLGLVVLEQIPRFWLTLQQLTPVDVLAERGAVALEHVTQELLEGLVLALRSIGLAHRLYLQLLAEQITVSVLAHGLFYVQAR